jgi:hypothetical protein
VIRRQAVGGNLPAVEIHTSNLGVGGSNPSERANDFNYLRRMRRSKAKIRTVFRTANFFVRPLRAGL